MSDTYRQEVAGGGRRTVSAASAIPSTFRIYALGTGGDIVGNTSVSVPHIWQPQQYEPSTVLNVKIVEHKSPTANSAGSMSVGRSSDQQHELVGSNCHRAGTVHTQPASYLQVTSPPRCGGQVRRHSTPVTASSPRAMGWPTWTVQRSPEIPSSSQQRMVNTRVIQRDVRPQALNRESVLQKLDKELQLQISRSRPRQPLSSVRTCADSMNELLVRPVAMKPQPSMQGFHPFVLRATSTTSTLSAPPSIVLPTAAQIASSSNKGTWDSSSVPNFSPTKRSLGSSQPIVHSGPPSSFCGADTWHPCPTVNQPVSATQSVHFGSPDRSSVSRWSTAAGTPDKGSFAAPPGQASSPASDTQHVPVPSWPTAHCSPAHSHQSQSYISQRYSMGSPVNYSSSDYSFLLSQVLSDGVQSSSPATPRHVSPTWHTGVSSPAKSFSPHQRLMSPYRVPQQNSTSDIQGVATPSETSLDLRRGYSSPVSSYHSPAPTLAEPPKYGVVRHGVGSPSKSFSAAHLLSKANSSQMSSVTFSSPQYSAMSLTTNRSGSHPSSAAKPAASLAASCSLQGSAAGLRHHRLGAPHSSALPFLPCQLQQPGSMPSSQQMENQPRKQTPRVLPPARERVTFSQRPQQRVMSASCQNRMFFQQQFLNVVAASSSTTPPPQRMAPAKVRKTAGEMPVAPSSAMISPSKFFIQGSLDFDSYIGKPILRQNEVVVKSDHFVSSAGNEVAKPLMKSLSPVSVGRKRKLDQTGVGLPSESFSEAHSLSEHSISQAGNEVPKPVKKSLSPVSVGRKRKLDQTGVGLPSKSFSEAHSLSEQPMSSAANEVAKPVMKSLSPVSVGQKRKLDQTDSETEDHTKRKMVSGFGDKFQESLSIQELVENADADPLTNKRSANQQVLEKEPKVRIILFTLWYLDVGKLMNNHAVNH